LSAQNTRCGTHDRAFRDASAWWRYDIDLPQFDSSAIQRRAPDRNDIRARADRFTERVPAALKADAMACC
jgi:hypothetical protein